MADIAIRREKVKRDTIKGSLTQADAFLLSEDATTPILAQILQREVEIESTWFEFDEVQTVIDLAEEYETMQDDRIAFEEVYFDIISRFDQLIATCTDCSNSRRP